MAAINTGKVVTGGLVAGLVFNILDFLTNAVLFAEDFRANAVRLGLDPAMMESASGIATWVVIDFVFGILAVFTYAAVRPRLGPGPKTAAIAGGILWAAIALVMLGLTQGGLFTMAFFTKMAVVSLVTMVIGTNAGAWLYTES
ncbi:MAG: hypothetical protein HY654_13925 [Acidobacteria bacterium]|nr:hypothetical protein [Acidobacteriota bacterium]